MGNLKKSYQLLLDCSSNVKILMGPVAAMRNRYYLVIRITASEGSIAMVEIIHLQVTITAAAAIIATTAE